MVAQRVHDTRAGTTFGKAPRFQPHGPTNQIRVASAIKAHSVLNEIDNLLHSLGPLRPKSTPAPSKDHPNLNVKHQIRSPAVPFSTSSRIKPQRKSSLGPGMYDTTRADKVVRRRLAGSAWPSPPPQKHLLSQPTDNNATTDDSSTESDSSACSVEKFVQEALRLQPLPRPSTTCRRARRSPGFHSISYTLVDRRVTGAPLMAQAARSCSSTRKLRRRGLVCVLTKQAWSTRHPTWLPVQLHSSWLRRTRCRLVSGFGLKVSRRSGASSLKPSEWTAPQCHQPWIAQAVARAWSKQLGRDRVQCKVKGAKKIFAFCMPLSRRGSCGAKVAALEAPKRKCRGALVQYDKAVGRNDAVGPFGAKPDSSEWGHLLARECVDLNVDRACVQPRVPSVVLPRRAWRPRLPDNCSNHLDLCPQYSFGKKRVKGVVRFERGPNTTSRVPNEKVGERVPVEMKYHAVEPRVKGIVAYQPTNSIMHHPPDANLCILQPSLVWTMPRHGGVQDMSKTPDRWQVSPTLRRRNQDHILFRSNAKDAVATSARVQSKYTRMPSMVDMAKQLKRVDSGRAKGYSDANYDISNQARILGTSTNASKTVVNLAKASASRPQRLPCDERTLDLDVAKAIHASSTSKRALATVHMAMQGTAAVETSWAWADSGPNTMEKGCAEGNRGQATGEGGTI
ncbi:hypothetical protein H310_01308 [Aphanomyces invadans]|uniref:Uncharacterized protein n=1 Tax=Aphanomyces invadans TaxID=157072 RepID=A0A024URI8_9STRA|nr:hypothetical protein H310_01308 [Aphanomyces invadans]ETW08795.1 hypothetical protein H310_01308 [Aphanomyces invadans]|eukprot:XP_008862600.1 hypothetical protein H310_01308 [Aphanomyces invadans]